MDDSSGDEDGEDAFDMEDDFEVCNVVVFSIITTDFCLYCITCRMNRLMMKLLIPGNELRRRKLTTPRTKGSANSSNRDNRLDSVVFTGISNTSYHLISGLNHKLC